MVRNWTLVLMRKHLARSVPFHTVLCNKHGRMSIRTPQAKRLRVNINTFPCLSFIGSGVITGSVCTLLDTGQGELLVVWINHAEGEWQETEEEFRCRSGDRRAGQQDDEGGGEEPVRPN